MKSWLYCPGNNPKMIINAPLFGAEGLVLDLEDSVRPEKKKEARFLTARAVRESIVPAESTAVRINGIETPYWKEDLEKLIPSGVRIIRLPKTETPEQIRKISEILNQLETAHAIGHNTIRLQIILETPIGVENAFVIAASSERLESLSFGAEDYCASVGIRRGTDLRPLDYPRSRIASAASAYGLYAYDTVWGFIKDSDGLLADAERARSLGFSGKSVIHPDQIDPVNRIFSPSAEEICQAEKILKLAENMKSGAESLEGRMIDRPVILRARRILDAAR